MRLVALCKIFPRFAVESVKVTATFSRLPRDTVENLCNDRETEYSLAPPSRSQWTCTAGIRKNALETCDPGPPPLRDTPSSVASSVARIHNLNRKLLNQIYELNECKI